MGPFCIGSITNGFMENIPGRHRLPLRKVGVRTRTLAGQMRQQTAMRMSAPRTLKSFAVAASPTVIEISHLLDERESDW